VEQSGISGLVTQLEPFSLPGHPCQRLQRLPFTLTPSMPALPPTNLNHHHRNFAQVHLQLPHSHAYNHTTTMPSHHQQQPRSYPTDSTTTTTSASQYQQPHHRKALSTTASPPVSTSSSRSSLNLEPREDVAEWCHQMHMMQKRRYDWCNACYPSPTAPLAVPSHRVMQSVRLSREESHAYQ